MKLEKLEKDFYYHIYNRGINSETIFKNDDNKSYFLNLVGKHISHKVQIIAFCLMNTHFHLVVKVSDENKITEAFSNLFNAYAKAFNKQQHRTGSLFEKHFKRKRLISEDYLKNAILYVHSNPTHAIQEYPFSSYFYYVNGNNPAPFTLDHSEIERVFDSVENLRTLQEASNITSADLQGFENLAGQSSNLQDDHNLQGLKDLVGLN